MAVGFPKGMPVFSCDGEGCPHVFRGTRFKTAESATIAREAGWTVTELNAREWAALCGRCAVLREQVAD